MSAEILAKLDLIRLDEYAAQTCNGVPPVAREVSKAMTVARLHPGVEAHVICDTMDDAVEAIFLLAENVRGKWDKEKLTLEFPNGSAVVVKMR